MCEAFGLTIKMKHKMEIELFSMINACRLKKGMSERELADKLGMTLHGVRGWFYKNEVPPMGTLHKLAQVLGTSMHELYKVKINGEWQR